MSGDEQLDAWGYTRLSQEGRDGSLDEQMAAVRKYAADHPDIDLVTTLNEGASTSGFDNDREKYTRLVDKVRDDEIDAVVVRDRARLSRDFDERLRLLTYFRSSDVELHVVEDRGRIDIDDVQTAAMECVHAAMDHIKKKAEIHRSKQAIKERMERGDDHGRPPFGLQYDDAGRRWVPDRESGEFATALEVVRLREDDVSWRDIADETGVNTGTARRVYERKERYLEEAEAAV
ncbi:MAG: recombinase family protein [Haloarculaceae archaeon]